MRKIFIIALMALCLCSCAVSISPESDTTVKITSQDTAAAEIVQPSEVTSANVTSADVTSEAETAAGEAASAQEQNAQSGEETNSEDFPAGVPLMEYVDGYNDDCKVFIRNEKVGGIAIDMTYDEVVQHIGAPFSENEPYKSDDGEMTGMTFSNGSVEIEFVTDGDVKKVDNYRFYEASGAITDSGISIGSTRQDVINTYGSWISVDDSIPYGEYEKYPDLLVTFYELDRLRIGSWQYGDITFEFDSNDKVSSISGSNGTSM